MIGTHLGPYDVVAKLGEGGMGEVYRARDTRLKRDVALKVLPESFASDPERLARFAREAELLAALNHPNIAAIYGVEETGPSAGSGQAATRALVMELVEGETLADRIGRGAVPVDEALAIAKQIADALEAAHERAVIHRDLKPANIKVRDDGTVKVLDFGLAKLADSAQAVPATSASLSPTITSPALVTNAGVLLGTAAYMSPEQARGRPADKRADIWAFGCVLYEMLTGRRAFEGEDVSDTLAAVLRAEPSWHTLPPDVPRAVATLLRSCLQKDPRRRLRDVAAAVFVLDQPAALEGSPVAASDGGSARWSFRRRAGALAASAAAAAALGGLSVWTIMRASPSPPSVTSIQTPGMPPIVPSSAHRDLAITRDGGRIVYRGADQLLTRAFGELEARTLVTGAAPYGMFVSPDDATVGFFESNVVLKVVPIGGGTPVEIARVDGVGGRGATFGEDGTIIYATSDTSTGLQRVREGGVPEVLTRPTRGEGDHLWPEMLPGDRGVLYTISSGTFETARLAVFDLKTGESKPLVDGTHAQYLRTGHLLFGVPGGLRAVRFDLDRLEVRGDSRPVLSGSIVKPSGSVNAMVSATGSLAYVEGSEGARRQLVWVAPDRKEDVVRPQLAPYLFPRAAPRASSRVLVAIEGEDAHLAVFDQVRGTIGQLTFEPGAERDPVWTSDDARILYFASGAPGGEGIFARRADGVGDATRLASGNLRPGSLGPADAYLMYVDLSGAAGTLDVGRLELKDGAVPEPLLSTRDFNETSPAVSPDGRWLAFVKGRPGRVMDVYVASLPDTTQVNTLISVDGGSNPVWGRDGRTLYYQRRDALMSVRITDGLPSSWGAPIEILRGPYFLPESPRQFDVGADGRFLMLKEAAAQDGAAPQMVLWQGWTSVLEALMRRR